MRIFTVCFFGHRRIDDFLLAGEKVYQIVCSLLREHEYVDFLVGREGDFDQIAASAVIKAKQNIFDANSSLIWVQPYPKAEYQRNRESYGQYYDAVEICAASEKAYRKAAIQIRNREMVDRSDLCVFFVTHSGGGAWQSMRYAQQKEKEIINIGEKIGGVESYYG